MATMSNKQQLEEFLACLYNEKDFIEVRCFGTKVSNLPAQTSCGNIEIILGKFDDLEALNGDGYNIYTGVLPRKYAGATKDDECAPGWVIWADADDTSVDAARKALDAIGMPPPTVVVDSGHGAHVYWGLETAEDPQKLSDIVKDLMVTLSWDISVRNKSRVMRLPGFTNHKEPKAQCSLIFSDISRRYKFEQLRAIVPVTKLVETKRESTDNPRTAAEVTNRVALIGRAKAYIMAIPGSTHPGRNDAAFKVAAALTNDFRLTNEEALPILTYWDSVANTPSIASDKDYSPDELTKVLRSANRYAKKAAGCKVNKTESAQTANMVVSPSGLCLDGTIAEEKQNPAILVTTPWPKLCEYSGIFRGNQYNVIAAGEGHRKTLSAIQLAYFLFKSGETFSYLPLEDDRSDWESRALCFLARDWTPIKRDAASLPERERLLSIHRDELIRFCSGCKENPAKGKINPSTGKKEVPAISPDDILNFIEEEFDKVNNVSATISPIFPRLIFG